MWVMQMGEVSL